MKRLEIQELPEKFFPNLETDDNDMNESIFMSSETMKNFGIKKGDMIKIKTDEINKFIDMKALEISGEEVCKDVGYITKHVYVRVAGNSISRNKIDVITLGCDPEFFLFSSQGSEDFGRIMAYKRKHSICGRDIGLDGAGYIGEFRPPPAENELELTNNISKLINQTKYMLNEAQKEDILRQDSRWTLKALSYYGKHNGRPAGFHVHLGLPPAVLRSKVALSNLVSVLDYFVGIPCLGIDREYLRRIYREGFRHSGYYGKPMNYKWGSVTLEYRFPGGYHLRHPDLTRGLIGMSHMVAEDFLARTKVVGTFEVKPKLIYRTPPIDSIKEATLSVKDPRLDGWIQDISTKVEKMITYQKHKSSVEAFLTIAREEKEVNPDILQNWR